MCFLIFMETLYINNTHNNHIKRSPVLSGPCSEIVLQSVKESKLVHWHFWVSLWLWQWAAKSNRHNLCCTARLTTFYSSSVKKSYPLKKYPLVFNMPMNCLFHKDFKRKIKSRYTKYGLKKRSTIVLPSHVQYRIKRALALASQLGKGWLSTHCPRVLGVADPWRTHGGPFADPRRTQGTEGEPASAWTAAPPSQMSNSAKPAQFHHFGRV